MIPSVKTLMRLSFPIGRTGIDKETAKKIRRYLENATDKMRWRISADRVYQTLCFASEALGAFGVEPINGAGHYSDSWLDGSRPIAEYVNMGDTYDTALLFDYTAGRFVVTSWGDWVEARERKGVTIA
jgi:hypothetical protein